MTLKGSMLSLGLIAGLWSSLLHAENTSPPPASNASASVGQPAPAPSVPAAMAPPKGSLEQIKERLTKREKESRQQSDKMATLYREGLVARVTAEKAKRDWETVKNELTEIEKLIAETKPAPSPTPTMNPTADASPPAIPIPPPDVATLAAQIQKTTAAIELEEKEIKTVNASIAAARAQISATKKKLEAIIVETRRARQRVHPLILAANDYLNVPYVWGGATSRGLDCSGLVYRALARLGISVPHSAASLFTRGKPVSLLSIRPGDLIFFADTYKPGISHVGIYLGGDRFLHASSGAGRVTIGALTDQYFINHFAGVRRIVK